ncbi:hypothetical protein L6452_34810 [Arctium lappa]|uniref:Uncharacterized protein n=1 Tax=Arctium lappa TaxID=4217 RepID=A0ACB8YJ74_ARCLA|nr:hypothetical protein L6452_34810 [Arctium lappa]
MMVVSHNQEGMASGSRPSLDHPTESQSQPSISISIPQSLLQKPTSPITNTYIRKKVKKAHSLLVPSPTKPLSPLMENSPLENIYRETTGVSPNPKEVLTEEMNEHMGEQAATTPASTEEDSGNINKTSPMATLNEQSFKGPRFQETKGVEGASTRQKTSATNCSNDPSKGGYTPGEGEDRYNYQELMDTMGNINLYVIKQGKDIEEMKLVILSQQVQITKLKKMVTRLVHKKRRRQFVLKKRTSDNDAFNKGENQKAEAEKESTSEMGFDFEGEKVVETEPQAAETDEIELDAKVAKQLQAELEKEEQLQAEKDRDLALEMAKKLNEEYQKSMQTAAEAKKRSVTRLVRRRDWTGLDRTELDRTGLDRTRQEARTGQDWTRQMTVLCLRRVKIKDDGWPVKDDSCEEVKDSNRGSGGGGGGGAQCQRQCLAVTAAAMGGGDWWRWRWVVVVEVVEEVVVVVKERWKWSTMVGGSYRWSSMVVATIGGGDRC